MLALSNANPNLSTCSAFLHPSVHEPQLQGQEWPVFNKTSIDTVLKPT